MKEKLLAISVAITTLIVFLIWGFFKNVAADQYILKAIITGLMSYGIYRLIFLGVSWLLPQIKILKKWLFGKEYIEGNWVGAYIGASGVPKIFYEKHEQTYDATIIKGYSFLLDKTAHTSWINTSFSINKEYEIFFTYKTQSFTETSSGTGYTQARAKFDKKNKYIIEFNGFFYDLHIGKQIPIIETKVDDDLSEEQLVDLAISHYNTNIEFYKKFSLCVQNNEDLTLQSKTFTSKQKLI